MEKQNTFIQEAEGLGINKETYNQIAQNLGRNPNLLELKIYSVMWSENLSYKTSVSRIASLPRKGEHVICGALEANAGVIDLENGTCCVFKMGTHNHPSGIDPYQGAATCIGDVCRDIVSLGAKPHVIFKSLRFGNSELERTNWLKNEIMKGMKDYSNALYLEDMGTELFYHSSYNTNPIVNVLVAGFVSKEKLLVNKPLKEGQKIFIVGNNTSTEGLDKEYENALIPKGKPGLANLLTDAISELNEQEALVRVENLDMAGILSATANISANANTGIDVNLNKVALAKKDINSEDILLSRTQERYILVAQHDKTELIKETFLKQKINCEEIGILTNHHMLRFFANEEMIAEVPAKDLVMGFNAPCEEKKFHELSCKNDSFHIEDVEEPENYWKVIKELLQQPNLMIKEHLQRSVIENRDYSPSDALKVLLKEAKKEVCFTVSGNSVYASSNPEKGVWINMARAVRRIVCSGGSPLAINNCLNFGSPFNEEVYSQFVATTKGLKDSCSYFKTPVVGGNVSFFNESSELGKKQAIAPTPVIGMMGVFENTSNHMSYLFRNKGDMIFLIGKSRNDISGSEYLNSYHNIYPGGTPYFHAGEEITIHKIVKKLIQLKLISSAHSVERGGLFFNLIESAMPLSLGFDITSPAEIRLDAFLFGESQGRVVVSVSMDYESRFVDFMMESALPFSALGHITKGELRIDDISYGYIDEYKNRYKDDQD